MALAARLCAKACQHYESLLIREAVARQIGLPPPNIPSTRSYHATSSLQGRKGGNSAFMKSVPPSVKARAKSKKMAQARRPSSPTKKLLGHRPSETPRRSTEASSRSLALMDPEELIDPDFGVMMEELMAPLETDEGKQGQEALLLEDPIAKRKDMTQRELLTGQACTIKEYNRLIRIFGAQGRFEEALQTYRGMIDQGLLVDSHSLTAIVTAAGQVHQPQKAEELMMEAEATLGIAPDAWTWGALISAYVKANQIEEGLDAFKRMKLAGHTQNLPICTTVLEGIYRLKGREKMMDFWLDMRYNGIEPDAVAYTVMMRALVRTGDVEKAMSFLDEMEQMGVDPTIVTYNTILRAAAESPLWFPGYNDYVYEVLGRLESSCLAPNAYTYETLIRLCARAANPIMAERYLEKMKEDDVGPTQEAYHQLLRAYAMAQSAGVKGGKIPKAMTQKSREEYAEIADNRRLLAPMPDEVDLKALIKAGQQAEKDLMPDEVDLKASIKAGKQAEKESRKKLSKKALARKEAKELALLKARQEEEKKLLLANKVTPLAVTYEGSNEVEGGGTSSLREGETIEDRLLGQQGVIGERGEGEDEKSLVPRMTAVDLHEGERALVLKGGLLETLPTERGRVEFNGLMPFENGLHRLDLVKARLPPGLNVQDVQELHIKAAGSVLAQMKSVGLTPTIETMNHYLAVHAEALRLNRAFEVLNQAFVSKGLEPDQRSYFTIIKMLVRAKRMTKAFEVLKMMQEEKGIKPNVDTLGVMMEALGRRGEVTPALHLLEVMAQEMGYTPKEWHVRPLRRAMKAQNLRHPLVPKDPREWLLRGFQLRKKEPGKETRRIRNFLNSQLASVMA